MKLHAHERTKFVATWRSHTSSDLSYAWLLWSEVRLSSDILPSSQAQRTTWVTQLSIYHLDAQTPISAPDWTVTQCPVASIFMTDREMPLAAFRSPSNGLHRFRFHRWISLSASPRICKPFVLYNCLLYLSLHISVPFSRPSDWAPENSLNGKDEL